MFPSRCWIFDKSLSDFEAEGRPLIIRAIRQIRVEEPLFDLNVNDRIMSR